MSFSVLRVESLFTGVTAPATSPTLPQLKDEINANVTITTVCEDVQWNRPEDADREIAIIFAGAGPLSGPELTELDTVVIPAHTGNGADTIPDTTTATVATRTGIRNGGVLSATGTTFTITDGDGFTVDNFTDPNTPDPVPTVWTGITTVTITAILTTEFTIIALDSAGNPLQLSTFTAPDFRDKILVGLVEHPGGTVLTSANTQVDLHEDGMSAFRDLMQIIGLLNDSGNLYSKSTIAALGLNVTAGTMFFPGIGRDGTVSGFKDPNREAQGAATDLSFVYVRGDGSGGITVEGATETNINVTELDDGAGGKVSMTGSRWKIDLISRNLKGPTWVEFGTVEFSTREAAIASVSSQPTLLDATFLTRFGLVVQRNAADLTSTNATFVQISHAGTSSAGSSGGDVFGPGGGVVVAGEMTRFVDPSGQLIEGTGIISSATAIDMQGIDIEGLKTSVGAGAGAGLQDGLDRIVSAGHDDGGVISDGGGGTVIDISAGDGALREANTLYAEIHPVGWPIRTGVAIALDQRIFFGVRWNAGVPDVIDKASDTWNFNDEFPLGEAFRDTTGLHITNDPLRAGDAVTHTSQRFEETFPLARDIKNGGLILGETGTRNITLSAGKLWGGLNDFVIAAIDTSISGSFDGYFRDGGGGFNVNASLTQWPNTQFDDGSGTLATMTNNRFANLFFYLGADGDIVFVYGRDEFTSSSSASEEPPPTDLPPRLQGTHTRLIARLRFEEGAATADLIESVFDILFTTSSGGVTDHGALAGLLDDDHPQYILNGTPRFGEGCRLEFTSGTIVSLRAGSVFDLAGFQGITIASAVAVNTATVGAVNGIDAGSLAARTWYAVYAIGDSNGVNASGGLISLSFTSPTLPGTHDIFRRVGALFTDDVPGFRDFIQTGNDARRVYQYRDDVQGPDQAILRQGGATAFVNLDAAEVIPPATVTRRVARLTVINESAGVDAFIRHAVNPEARGPHVIPPGNSQRVDLRLDNTTTNIQYGHSGAGGSLTVLVEGYEEQLEDDL